MALKINYNYQTDFGLVNLARTEQSMNTAMQRLQSGMRINTAADDAAGYFISDQLKTYSISLDQGTRNANDGISIAQIAQGALKEVYNILNDIKQKAIQASNTSDDTSRGQIQQDINSLVDSIAKIFKDTEFNGLNIFSSSGQKTFTIHYGGRTDQEIVLTTATAGAASNTITAAGTITVGGSAINASLVTIGTTGFTIDVTTQAQANATVSTVDALIKAVDDMAAQFGSYQIELQKIINNNDSQRINTNAAYDRVRNANMAEEMSNFTKYQILMQSGIAMLAQANQSNQLVLQLLR
ncbi:flagellin B [Venenivibrio stagnispumantis]|uniref:Flagellin n=1 Tax=Venenivibrio stagnispumantis TaxID=407998 RepID=A0AA46ACJ4_9AQUI|nr:flagellin [Venenivibrio stagnispumantis]MCW4572738.1 flagellin [Venenivibrio stagnispumantis]SMP00229.1 flagellin [Venenivibrio stagnispumantis]